MQEPYLYVNSRLLRRKRQKQRKILTFFILLILVIILIFIAFPKSKSTRTIAVNAPTPTPTSTLNVQIASSDDSLEKTVQAALAGSHGTYAVAVKNLTTGESYYLNSHTPFETASLYKLWVAGAVLKRLEDGTLTEDQVLSQDAQILNKKFSIASESAELKEGRITHTVGDALSQMITYSDNYSALLLTEKIRLSSLSTFLAENDLSESAVGDNNGDPTTTAADVSVLLEKLYKGQLGNEANTQKLIDLLKAQQINGKIPKNLPQGMEIAHKTGELGSFSHDAAIIYTPDANYILVVLSETDSKLGADSRIADVSKSVYDYFVKRQ